MLAAALVALFFQACGGLEPEAGVSLELAESRAAAVSDVEYDLHFEVPSSVDDPVTGTALISFALDRKQPLQLDFTGAAYEGSCEVNGVETEAAWVNEHILIPATALKKGRNNVRIDFTSSDSPLNRNEEYLYTLFVPAHAREAFPCFDQPDLKAVFKLSLNLPEGWKSMASDSTKKIPTYLFSFTAGKFSEKTAECGGREIRALYRETDPLKIAQLETVFDYVDLSLNWLEEYTGMACPFEEYGFVVLPGYQFGGVEHPGAIQYNDTRIFLGENPSPDEEQARLELIAHETSHLWFGDCVTMKWFDDVWTKEVFANFLASKIAKERFAEVNHDLNFLRMYQTGALATDRTGGTHPIRQPLENLSQAGLLYGNIIYDKAPVMMRKMEEQMGVEQLRNGIQEYLRAFSYGNATWNDLIAVLSRHNPDARLEEFSEVWVNQKGMPTVECSYVDDCLVITQKDPFGRGLVWPQRFSVGVKVNGQMKTVSVNMQEAELKVLMQEEPEQIVPNIDGRGYGLFPLPEIPSRPDDELYRYALAMNLHENWCAGLMDTFAFADLMTEWAAEEDNELIASALISYLADALSVMPLGGEDGEGTDPENQSRRKYDKALFGIYQNHPLPSVRQKALRTLYAAASCPETLASVYSIWEDMSEPLMSVRDYMKMSYHLAIMFPDRSGEIVKSQRERLDSPDLVREYDFVSRGCSPSFESLQALFEELLEPENRAVEPWASQLLALLNDPAREPENNVFILPGLNELEEIQRTGDIFFPGNWLAALLKGHHSPQAAEIVTRFIEEHSEGCSPALMNKLKENAYFLVPRP